MRPIAAFAPNTALGEFVLLRPIGEGATGIVYEAMSRRAQPSGADSPTSEIVLPSRVALKVLHSHLGHVAQTRGRFFREMKILSTLDCARIPKLYRWGSARCEATDVEVLYCAIELVVGCTLRTLLENEPAVPCARMIAILAQVCEALSAAHALGVVHRDLKPENILVGSDDLAYVIDFGMAKVAAGVLAAAPGNTQLTKDNMLFGTPAYMAPEQARGEPVDGRTDVYAVGMLIYEWLAGKTPFSDASPLETLAEVLRVEPKAPIHQVAPANPALDAVAMFAIAKSANERYASATALLLALRQAQESPMDVERIHPSMFGTAVAQADAHSKTMPQLPAQRSVPVSAVVRGDDGMPVSARRAPNSVRKPEIVKEKSNETAAFGVNVESPPRRFLIRSWLRWGLAGLFAICLGAYLALRSG
jgi:serine/threonine protein kinase